MNISPEAQARLQALIKHYQSDENKDFSRLLVDKSGNVITDKDGIPTIQVFTTGVVKDTNDAEFTIDHLISTPRIDYIKDVMDPFGMDDTALQKNKGVFYNHCFTEQTSLPIGKNLWIKKQRDGVLACTKYAVNENPFAKDVYSLVKGGYLNSYSIGFKYDQYDILTISSLLQLIGNKFDIPNVGEFDPGTSVWYHKTWKCHEYSQVGVPMNQDAVRKSLRKALDANVVQSIFGKSLFESIAERSIAVIPQPEQKNDEGQQGAVVEEQPAPSTKSKGIEESIQGLTNAVQGLTLEIKQFGQLTVAINEKLDQVLVLVEVDESGDEGGESSSGEQTTSIDGTTVEKAGEQSVTTEIDGQMLFKDIASRAISSKSGQ